MNKRILQSVIVILMVLLIRPGTGYSAGPWTDLLKAGTSELPTVEARDLGSIFFTSGTTDSINLVASALGVPPVRSFALRIDLGRAPGRLTMRAPRSGDRGLLEVSEREIIQIEERHAESFGQARSDRRFAARARADEEDSFHGNSVAEVV